MLPFDFSARAPAIIAAHALAFPRAVHAAPRANTDPARVVAQLTAAFDGFKANHEGQMANAQAAIDDLNTRLAALGVSGALGGGAGNFAPEDPTYTAAFASWFRHGEGSGDLKAANAEGKRQAIQASMSVGSSQDGGYLAPTEWNRRIEQALRPLSPMRRIANVISTSVNAYQTVWSDQGWGSGWVGETASRPQTVTPTLAPLIFASGEIYANPAVTQRLLDDADFQIEAWLAAEVAQTFELQEGPTWISGDGVNKPRGILTYVTGGASDGHHPGGNLTVVPGGAAANLSSDGLVDFVYSLPSPYRQNARWLMSSLTAAAAAKLKDGQGNYLWRETYVSGQPATLLGYPVELDENMPGVAAGNLPIAFGDFRRGYVINDRFGVRTLRDPYTNKPFVSFYTTKRVGGGVLDPRAIRLMRIAAAA